MTETTHIFYVNYTQECINDTDDRNGTNGTHLDTNGKNGKNGTLQKKDIIGKDEERGEERGRVEKKEHLAEKETVGK